MFIDPIAIMKNKKTSYVVVDYTKFSNFAKTKKFVKLFLPLYMAPRLNLLCKKVVENLVSLSL